VRNPRILFLTARMTRVITAALILTFSVNVSMAQKVATSKSEINTEVPQTRTSEVDAPTPVVFPGNPTCATINASTNPAFSHIEDDFGFKIDEASPNYANVPFNNGSNPSRSLMGGAGADVTRTVSVSTTAGNTFNWSSTKAITAVIVKGGPNGANVYPYNPFSFGGIAGGGTGLTTPGAYGVSHVVFCFGLQLAPSAANASITGRVLDSTGMPIRGATIQIWNVTAGSYAYAYTNTFGYYTLVDLPVADFYVITANHGRYIFENNERSFTLDDNLTGVDFVAVQ
jgi:hypothetical protein